MTVAGGQVAERAGARLFPASIRNDRRHRRVVARIPVGRAIRVVDLDLVVFLFAAGLCHDLGGVALGRALRGNRVGPWCIFGREQHRRHGDDRRAQDERRSANDILILHRILPLVFSRT